MQQDTSIASSHPRGNWCVPWTWIHCPNPQASWWRIGLWNHTGRKEL